MLVVAASRFRKQFPQAEIRIFTEAPDHLMKIIPYAIPILLDGRAQWNMRWNIIGGLHKILPSAIGTWLQHQENLFKLKYHSLSRWWIIRRLSVRGYDVTAIHAYISEIEQADIVIASGGGYITDSFEDHACSLLQTLALAQLYGKPTAMFGQGLGPVMSSKLLCFVNRVLPALDYLSLRESLYSKPFALSIGVSENKINVTGDDAVDLVYSKASSSLGTAIGINLRMASYSGLNEGVLDNIKDILNSVTTKLGVELRPIPIANHKSDSDVHAIRSLLTVEAIESAMLLDTPEKVIEQVKGCRIVITGSYHAGVFALSQGISVICIVASDYYRHKFEGLANQFGIGCQIVDRESLEFFANLKAAICSGWDDADNIRQTLLQKAQEQISLSESTYLSFTEKLVKDQN